MKKASAKNAEAKHKENEYGNKLSVESFYFNSNVMRQEILKANNSPITSGSSIDSNDFVGILQTNLGFVVIVEDTIFNTVFLVDHFLSFFARCRLTGRFLNVFFKDIFSFHSLLPFLKVLGALCPSIVNVRFSKTYHSILARILKIVKILANYAISLHNSRILRSFAMW